MLSNTVYLTSYMRPEMTASSIRDILKWNSLDKLTVIVDGLRSNATSNEMNWRARTIEVIEEFCQESNKMELWVYDSNLGITEHAMRIQKRALEVGHSGIWLEEDIGIDLERYSRIVQGLALEKSNDPILLSGYTHFNHVTDDSRIIKSNLFLPLWGTVFNESFYELISKVWQDKKFDSTIVSRAIGNVFSGQKFREKMYRGKLIDFWSNYSSWGFQNSNRWDAVANYALWTKEKYSLTTYQRLAHDLSFKDSRGMNQRKEPDPVRFHEFTKVDVGDQEFCLPCEEWGSRFDKRLSRRLQAGLKYRFRSRD